MRTIARICGAIGIAALAVASLGPPVAAQLAPGGAAGEGTAVEVETLDTRIGSAEAEADAEGGSSSSTPIRVLGHDVGSTSSSVSSSTAGEGSSDSGSTAEVPVGGGSLRVAPYENQTSTGGDGSTHSSAYSAVLDANVPGLVEMRILSGEAEAVWAPSGSNSRAASDGAAVSLFDGDVVVVLLHAEGHSDGTGHLYVVRLNDLTFVESEGDGEVTIEVPGVATIALVDAEATSRSFTGQVVDVVPVGGPDLGSTLSFVHAEGDDPEDACVGPECDPCTVDCEPEIVIDGCGAFGTCPEDDPEVEVLAAGIERLPLTGGPILALVLVGTLLSVVGGLLWGWERMRVRAV